MTVEQYESTINQLVDLQDAIRDAPGLSLPDQNRMIATISLEIRRQEIWLDKAREQEDS